MALVDPSCGELSRTHIDGVPLSLAPRLLPVMSRFKPGLLMHCTFTARSEARTTAPPQNGARTSRAANMGRTAMLGLVDSLERCVRGLDVAPAATLWSTYGTHLNYSDAAQAEKRQLVARLIASAQSGTLQSVWDLGANTGEYSKIAADAGARVMAFDGDHAVVEQHFRSARQPRRRSGASARAGPVESEPGDRMGRMRSAGRSSNAVLPISAWRWR